MLNKQEVQEIISQENAKQDKRRDKQLDDKLDSFVEKVSRTIDKRIADIPVHQTAPGTVRMIDDFKINCVKINGANQTRLGVMDKDIKSILKTQKEILETLKNDVVSKTEFDPYKKKTDKIIGGIWGALIFCALVVVYYVLNHIGLPKP